MDDSDDSDDDDDDAGGGGGHGGGAPPHAAVHILSSLRGFTERHDTFLRSVDDSSSGLSLSLSSSQLSKPGGPLSRSFGNCNRTRATRCRILRSIADFLVTVTAKQEEKGGRGSSSSSSSCGHGAIRSSGLWDAPLHRLFLQAIMDPTYAGFLSAEVNSEDVEIYLPKAVGRLLQASCMPGIEETYRRLLATHGDWNPLRLTLELHADYSDDPASVSIRRKPDVWRSVLRACRQLHEAGLLLEALSVTGSTVGNHLARQVDDTHTHIHTPLMVDGWMEGRTLYI